MRRSDAIVAETGCQVRECPPPISNGRGTLGDNSLKDNGRGWHHENSQRARPPTRTGECWHFLCGDRPAEGTLHMGLTRPQVWASCWWEACGRAASRGCRPIMGCPVNPFPDHRGRRRVTSGDFRHREAGSCASASTAPRRGSVGQSCSVAASSCRDIQGFASGTARSDYRDVLAAAEYPGYTTEFRLKAHPTSGARFDADWRQFATGSRRTRVPIV